MSKVSQWDPKKATLHAGYKEIFARVGEAFERGDIEISASDQESLHPILLLADQEWEAFASGAEKEEVVTWIKVLTLAEERLSGFDAGSRSPVIALVRHLKKRSALPEWLVKWIRANTSNRFLPYGSLNDRL